MRSMKVKKLETERDWLSDLPDHLLCHILSFLPIAETVRTRVLSTRWKNLYTLVSTLNLDDYKYSGKGFMSIVDRVLFARKGIDVNKFVLTCRTADPSRAEGWVQYALWHNVRELELDLWGQFMLPAGLFICKTLVSLTLYMDERTELEIPSKISLPSLKILCIMGAAFSDDDSVERLFSSCSVLEELILHSCFFDDITRLNISNSTLKRLTISDHGSYYYHNEVLINAPSLVYLKFDGFRGNYHLFMDLHSLVEAYIRLGPLYNSVFYESAITDLIRGLRHVQSLYLSGPFSRAFLPGQGPIPTLENMTNLKIGKFYHKGWQRVLNFAPCLETLVLEELPYYEKNIMKPPKEVPPCLISQMKAIKFLSFQGKKSEMRIVEYFLKHGQVLENLIIHLNFPQLKITKKLLKFPRVSEKCQVVIV